jgi:uncharacterized protein YqgQ
LKTLKLERLTILLSLFLLIVFLNPIYAETEVLKTKDITVLFEKPLRNVAEEVEKLYPVVKEELVDKLKWDVDFRPEVVLVKDKDVMMRMTGGDLIVAFAMPDRNLIVLDTSRVYTKPFTLEATLKHELCHLLLHSNIESEKLPRWLDEGVCQWASGGVAELMANDGDKALAKATISDRLISLENLRSFPRDDKSLLLAYEESKSLVEYIVNEYGEQGILQILRYLKVGYSTDDAIRKSLSVVTPELEMKWVAYLKRKYTWFSYLSHNLYTILFFLAALVTMYGFLMILKKKRAYVDEADKENEADGGKRLNG